MRNLKINDPYRLEESKSNKDFNPVILGEAEEMHRWAESRAVHFVFIIAIMMLCALLMFVMKVVNLLV